MVTTNPSPPHNNRHSHQAVLIGVVVILLAGLLLWAGASISSQGLSIARLEEGQKTLIKSVDKLSDNVEKSLGKVDSLENTVEQEKIRQNRLWDRIWKNEQEED